MCACGPGRRTVVLTLVVVLTLSAVGPASAAAGQGTAATSVHATALVDATFTIGNNTVNATVERTTDDTNDTVNDTTVSVENTTDDTNETINNAPDSTPTTVGKTANETIGTVDGVVEGTTDTVENTTNAVNDAVDGSVEVVEDTTGETIDSLESPTKLSEEDLLGEAPTNSQTPTSSATGSPSPTPAGPTVDSSSAPLPTGVGGNGSMPAGVAMGAGLVLAGAVVRTGIAGGAFPESLAGTAVRDGLSRLTRLVAPLRYSRWDDSDPLAHEGRAEVYDVVEESPGTYLSAVSEETDIPLSTLRHHVRVLEEEGLIAGASVRGRRRLYPAHTEDLELAAALNDEATAPVVDALARVGPASVSDLADAVGKDASTLTHHLKRLEEDGIVERERDGRAIVNRLAPEAHAALAPAGADVEPPEAPVSAD